jgi:hypothetical protein
MAHSAFPDLADAIYAILNVPALTAPPPIGAGARRVVDQPVLAADDDRIPFPFVWYELGSERSSGGLGPGPWLLEVDIRIHVFSQSNGMQEAQGIAQKVIELLRAAEKSGTLDVNGWWSWYQPHDDTITLPFELLNGDAVRELVVANRAYVEERIA